MYIKLYFAANDQEVSEAPTTTHAVEFTLRADQNQIGSWIRLYALAEDDYEVTDTDITIQDSTAVDKWELAQDDSGSPVEQGEGEENWGDPLELGTVGDTTKVYFWIRARAVDTETPVNDVSVTLKAEGIAASTL
jgi:hypothetical protein